MQHVVMINSAVMMELAFHSAKNVIVAMSAETCQTKLNAVVDQANFNALLASALVRTESVINASIVVTEVTSLDAVSFEKKIKN